MTRPISVIMPRIEMHSLFQTYSDKCYSSVVTLNHVFVDGEFTMNIRVHGINASSHSLMNLIFYEYMTFIKLVAGHSITGMKIENNFPVQKRLKYS